MSIRVNFVAPSRTWATMVDVLPNKGDTVTLTLATEGGLTERYEVEYIMHAMALYDPNNITRPIIQVFLRQDE